MNNTVPVNSAFLWLYTDKSRFKVLYGGAGSSKSHSAMQYVLSRFLTEKGANGVIIRKVANTLKKSVFASAKKILRGDPNHEEPTSRGLGIPDTIVSINNSDLVFKNKKNDNLIFFMGMDDPEKIKSITAENGDIQWIFFEEASEAEQSDIDQLNTRLRGLSKHHKEIIICFNPVTEDHWLKQAFFDNPSYDNIRTHHSTVDDNAFVDQVYVDTLDAYKKSNPYHYMVYRLGLWGAIDENDVIIPYPLIYKAKDNFIKYPEGGVDVGVDAARYGDDQAVIYIRHGLKMLAKESIPKCDGDDLAKAVQNLVDRWKPDNLVKIRIKIDITGVGSACFDILNKYRIIPNAILYPINFSSDAKDKDQYANCATEMYYETRDIIPNLELLKDDEGCYSQLTRRKYSYDGKVRKKIETKPDFKKRIKRSPDDADAFVLCIYNPPHISNFAVGSGDKDYSEYDAYTPDNDFSEF